MTVYGYTRVSSISQIDGTSLDSQESSVKSAGATIIYTDTYTGTTANRPKFQELLSRLVEGDTIVVTKLDRFARSTIDGCTIVSDLLSRGVAVNVLNMGLLEDTPVGRMMCAVMFAMAQFERDMIVERTSEGRQAARLKEGYREGRPAYEPTPEFKKCARLVKEGLMSASEAARRCGISRGTWYRYAKECA